ncbi:MAG: PD-(D/E)XK nuclease family protein [Clostridia bacterium]|nr:PD-(D/E)XK nuclease family protein [Clostridia bacterium]
MLEFLTGLQMSSKRKYISDKISQLVDEGRQVYLIVPEQSSFDREREYLFRFGELKSNKFEIKGFSHIARDVLEEYGLNVKSEADEAAKNVIMSVALEEMSDSLEIYKKHSAKITLISELLSAHSQIKQSGFSFEDLENAGRKSTFGVLRQKTKELSLIFSAYEALLGERFSDSSDNIRVLTEFLKSHRIFENTVLFIDDFRGFTGAQIKLIRELLSQCEDMYVSVTAPSLFMNCEGEAFSHSLKNAKNIRSVAKLLSVQVFEKNTDIVLPDTPLRVWTKSLYAENPSVYKEETDALTVYKAENQYDECDFVAREIKKLIETKKYRCREIAVVERGYSYSRIFTNALKRYGVPVFEDKRKPMIESVLVRLILSAVKAAAYGFSTENILECIKTQLSGFETEESCEIENYVYMWQIDSVQWLSDFTDNPSGFGEEMTEECRERLENINRIRRKAVSPLVMLKKELEKGEGESSLKAVYNYLKVTEAGENFRDYAVFLNENSFADEAVNCKRVWERVMLSLDALYAAIGSKKLSPKRFYELLEIILSSDDMGEIPAGIDSISIGSADRTRFFEPKVLFVLGANEGVFPPLASNSSVFTNAEKRELIKNSFVLESLPENIYAEERMIAFNQLTAPSERLYICYSNASLSGEALQKSEIVNFAMNIVPNCQRLDFTDVSREEKILSLSDAFRDFAVNRNDNTEFTASLKKVLEESPEYSGRLSYLENAAAKTHIQFESPEKATELFGESLRMSPSRIESYHKCPFMYFCRYGMGVSALEKAELNVRIHGLLVHFVLENLLAEYSYDVLKNYTDDELNEKVHSLVNVYVDKFMGGRDFLTRSLNRQLDRSCDIISEILKRLISEFGSSLFVTRDVELDISEKGDIKPYKLKLPSGGTLCVGGQVDRVDVMELDEKAYVRIVDYKTGGKNFRLGQVFEGLNMQMLIYMLCIWDNGKERYGDVVPAGVLYVPAKNSGERLSRRADDNEVIKQKLKNGRMNGLILENEDVLKGMDALAQGTYVDAYIDKKGTLKGNFLSLNNFRRLHGRIDEILISTAQDMHCGRIEALPVYCSGYERVCEYCEYADVCMREDTDEVRKIPNMSHKEAVEFLLKEEAENG